MPPLSPAFVFFDLDDTLLDHRSAEQQALLDVHATFERHLASLPVETLQETYHRHNRRLWRAYGAGHIDRPTLQYRRFSDTLTALEVHTLDPEFVGRQYMAFYADHWTWRQGATQTLRRVAAQFPLGLLTNGFADVQRAKLDRFPLLSELASPIVISEEIGHLKPDPRLFEAAARHAHVPPSEILYVGDSLTSDVEGGLNAGWQVAWYAPPDLCPDRVPTPRGAHVLRSWDDLLDLLGLGMAPIAGKNRG